MRLFVIGATGRTGFRVVEQALARGHEVTAFARSPDKMLPLRQEGLRVIVGDPHEASALAAAMAGHEAVVSALGPRSVSDDALLPRCTEAMLEAMHRARVRRVLTVSSALLYPNVTGVARLIRKLLAGSLRGASHSESLLSLGGVSWTVVRPVRLTDGALTRGYRLFHDRLPERPSPVPRADVAHLLLETLEHRRFENAIIGICR